MADAAASRPPDATPAGDPLAALRERGAARADPVRFRFLEALAARAATQRGDARRLLDARLARALAEQAVRFAEAQATARDLLAAAVARHPAAGESLQPLFAAGDFAALRRRIAALDAAAAPTPLAGLTARLAQHAPAPADADGAAPAAAGDAVDETVDEAELKSVRHFRATWAKLSVERQLAAALAQAPENAGPLNSHRLALRALERMHEISPDYLARFMSYAEGLLWLAQADPAGLPAGKGKGAR